MNNETTPVVNAPVLYKFTNQAESSHLDDLLAMFYRGVFGNSIGIMTAMNEHTKQEEVLLVGVVLDDEGKPDCFPIAKALSSEEVKLYSAPDGKGGYYNPLDPNEAEAVKEEMKPVEEAVVEGEPEATAH